MPNRAFNGWYSDPETFLAALRPWGLKQTGKDEYRARCPAHDGGDPNLAIRRDGDKVLVHCHSHGCTFEAIWRALGLERDPPRAGDSRRGPDGRFAYRDRRLPDVPETEGGRRSHNLHFNTVAPSGGGVAEDDGNVLAHCHAGCNQAAVIEVPRSRGLRNNCGPHPRPGDRFRPNPVTRDESAIANRIRFAINIWRASEPAMGTPVEAYLHSRGLTLRPPGTLRFHGSLKHPSGGVWPAMVALVTRGTDDAPLAIHRTFLAHDGVGKAPVAPSKMMLGPCRGGAVRLGDPGDALMVGEGIETCLAAMQATGRAAWAALSTSGSRTLDLPEGIRTVTVLADGDDPGEAAAFECARRWKRERRRVSIARPPQGLDFNDLLMGRVPDIGEAIG